MKFLRSLSVIVIIDACCALVAGGRTTQTFPGVAYYSETRQDPPLRLFVAEVDLTCPRVHVRAAPGGPDPDGPGHWQTTLMRPTAIADREKFDLVVNGDFFAANKTKNAEGSNATFFSATWATVSGPSVTDGRAWAASTNRRPCLVVHKDKHVSIELLSSAKPDDWEVIAGNVVLVKNGAAVPGKTKARHPRTAVGLDASGRKLIILVADGRRPGVSIGLSNDETAAEMLRLGCYQAINLDGGGSTVMAVRDAASGQMKILNTPSDGHERAVANALGVTVDP
jgi:exopolysaccharide biosynthesis protein